MPESATLPAPKAVPSATAPRPARWGQRVDAFTVALLVLFAFYSASFIARNSDFWLHLATGRLLVSGEYHFGSDPFAYTTSHHYWANHSWLFDIGLYKVWQWFGGAVLVAIKAAAVAALAGVMLLITRGKGPWWIGTVCVLLGTLALSPRALLQPAIASYLLLAVCLWCLKTGGRAYRAIPVAIAIWVNLDAWFLLGPSLVVIFWIGRKLSANEPSDSWPVWLIPGSLAASLVNPYHIHAFTLPFELSPSVRQSEFFNDPRFAALFLSPWHWRPLGMGGGYSLAAWAFFVLLALGIVSFAINRKSIRSWRLTVWLTFALLASWQARLIPFFAVVGAPICALNLREVVATTSYARLGRTFALVATVLLVLIGYFGRENGFYNRDRGVAWGIHTDPTLSLAAESIARWYQGHSSQDREVVFGTHVDLGHYLAWFAPGEKCFLDSRLQLFTHIAGDNAAISRALGLLPDADDDPHHLDELLQKYGITAIELYDPDPQRMTSALRQMTGSGPRWDVVRIDGGAVLLMPKGRISPGQRFNAERLTFGLNNNDELPQAANGPRALAEPAPPWVIEAGNGRIGSWEADAATVYLRLFEHEDPGLFVEGRPDTSKRSPALPLLAVRAARVGIEKDPADSTAWLVLARAYVQLGQQTWERDVGEALTPLGRIRRTQVIAALVQAVLLNPDSIPAHELLIDTFQTENLLDLEYRHAVEHIRLLRRAGPTARETREEFNKRIAAIQEFVDQLEQAVQAAENRFLIRTSSLAGEPLARARIAMELGLFQKAIDVLANSHFDLYGAEGLGLLIDLLLQTGQAADARNLLDRQELRKNISVLGFYSIPVRVRAESQRWSYRLLSYEWLNLCQYAAVGNYEAAREMLLRLGERLEHDERTIAPVLSKQMSVQLAVETGLAVPLGPLGMRLRAGMDRAYLNESLKQSQLFAVMRADFATITGSLELERGNIAGALEQGETALALYSQKKGLAPSLPGELLAEKYVAEIRRRRN